MVVPLLISRNARMIGHRGVGVCSVAVLRSIAALRRGRWDASRRERTGQAGVSESHLGVAAVPGGAVVRGGGGAGGVPGGGRGR